MDEPLSNLDAQLRAGLRAELKQFQRRTGRTFLYVTHDQLEALTLADRLAVMRDGRLEQVGRAAEVYARPANTFVASFVGQPPMNLIPAVVSPDRCALLADGARLAIAPPAGAPDKVTLGIRPEDFRAEPGEGSVEIEVAVERVEFIGPRFLVSALLGGLPLAIELPRSMATTGKRKLYVQRSRLHFFDPKSGNRL